MADIATLKARAIKNLVDNGTVESGPKETALDAALEAFANQVKRMGGYVSEADAQAATSRTEQELADAQTLNGSLTDQIKSLSDQIATLNAEVATLKAEVPKVEAQ